MAARVKSSIATLRSLERHGSDSLWRWCWHLWRDVRSAAFRLVVALRNMLALQQRPMKLPHAHFAQARALKSPKEAGFCLARAAENYREPL